METLEQQFRRAEIVRDYYRAALRQTALFAEKAASILAAGSPGERALRGVAEEANTAADEDFSNL